MVKWIHRLIPRRRRLDRFEDGLSDEVRAHIEHRADDLVRGGLPRDEALRRARVEFGAIEAYKEECRDASGPMSLTVLGSQIWREGIVAARRLRATPVFTAFAVLSLAVGLGVTIAFYSIMSVVLWPTSALDAPDRLVVLKAGRTIDWGFSTSRGDFDELRAAQTTMESVAGWTVVNASFIDGQVAERFRGEAVTGNAFDTLGIRMTSGRPIRPSDDRPDSPAVLVLSHAFWARQLRADPSVIGRVVRLSGQPFEVIGVADRSLVNIGRPDLDGRTGWIPLEALRRFSTTTPSALNPHGRRAEALSAIGRLRADRTVEEAKAEIAAIGARLDAVYPIKEPVDPASNKGGRDLPRQWSVVRADAAFSTSDLTLAWLLVALVALVLLVACTNLANLMLARGSARRQELAVRRALGASRWRLVREQVVESALVAAAGGLAAIAVIRGVLLVAASQIAPGVQFHLETDLAPGVIVAGALALGMTLVVFGLWPALYLTRHDPRAALAGDAGTGAIRWRTRRSLIVGQVTISAGFLLFAVMSIRAIGNETRRDAGNIDVDRLAMARFGFREEGWSEARARHAVDRVLELARAQSGVEAAAVTSGFPIGFTYDAALSTPAAPFQPEKVDYPHARFISATPPIFRVLGLPVVEGRAFDERDAAGAVRVALLSEAAAKSIFGMSRAVGRQILLRVQTTQTVTTVSDPTMVVGVVRDATDDARGGRNSAVYVPFAQQFMTTLDVVVRTAGDPEDLLVPLRTVVRQADPDLFAERSVTGVYRLDPGRWGLRYFGAIASLLGLVALVLAMVGLSGVLSHLVARRTREMGVRMALGATQSGIARMVLGDGIRPVVAGLILGIPTGLIGWFSFSPMARLPTSALDLPMFALVPVSLILAAMVACYLPARRASRVDPNVALKDL
jgi:predicted permease